MDFYGSFGTSEADALGVLMPVVDQALHAHQVGDYGAYVSVITDELAGKVTEDGFMRAHGALSPQLGTLQSRTLLASLRRGGNPMLLFAAKYSGTEDDVLVNVTFRNGTTPPLIEWLWIE